MRSYSERVQWKLSNVKYINTKYIIIIIYKCMVLWIRSKSDFSSHEDNVNNLCMIQYLERRWASARNKRSRSRQQPNAIFHNLGQKRCSHHECNLWISNFVGNFSSNRRIKRWTYIAFSHICLVIIDSLLLLLLLVYKSIDKFDIISQFGISLISRSLIWMLLCCLCLL